MWLHVAVAVGLCIALNLILNRAWPPSSSSSQTKGQGGNDKTKQSLHAARRLQHAATGLLFLAIFDSGFLAPSTAGATLLATALGCFALHRRRLSDSSLNDFLVRQFSHVLRTREIRGACPAAVHFQFGCGLSMLGLLQTLICYLFTCDPLYNMLVFCKSSTGMSHAWRC